MKKLLKELKNLEGQPSAISETGDFTYSLLLYLVGSGGIKSLQAMAKKFLPGGQKITVFQNSLKAYYYYGEPFESMGLAESEWPIWIGLETEKILSSG